MVIISTNNIPGNMSKMGFEGNFNIKTGNNVNHGI